MKMDVPKSRRGSSSNGDLVSDSASEQAPVADLHHADDGLGTYSIRRSGICFLGWKFDSVLATLKKIGFGTSHLFRRDKKKLG